MSTRQRRPPQEILSITDHRPWPMPDRPWVQRQSWLDFLFCHWPVPAAEIRERVPPQLALDLWDGEAWLGIIPFHMAGVTLRGLPDLPGFSAFPELNVRTYVRHGDRTGVYFLSLDAHSRLAVALARRWYGLAYFLADMSWHRDGGAVAYRSQRRDLRGAPAGYEARYEPGIALGPTAPGTFERWLVERYALFVVDRGGRVWQGDVHHEPWPVCDVSLEIGVNTMAASHGVTLPDTPPVALYSPGVDVVAWSPALASL
jgi:uncharacterized protein